MIDALCRTYGRDVVEGSLVESYVTDWSADPYSFGSYSHININGSAMDYEEMARSSGPIHFAGKHQPLAHAQHPMCAYVCVMMLIGEHTNRHWPCTVHGAYLSGARESRKIRHRLRSEWNIGRS